MSQITTVLQVYVDGVLVRNSVTMDVVGDEEADA